jgi:hypothetical protein
MENNDGAKPYFEAAQRLGIGQADVALEEIAKNRNIYKMGDKSNNKQYN